MSDSPSKLITADDKSALINLVTWTTMTVACLSAIGKVLIKWVHFRKQELDDVYMAVALAITICFDIAVSFATSYGLGRHAPTESGAEIADVQKSLYASEFLYIVSICLSKMPILQFLKTLARESARRKTLQAVIVLNMISLVIGILCVAFQCGLPNAWEFMVSSKCMDQIAFWDFFGAMDILIDLAIVVLPIYLLHDLHIKRSKKIPAMAAFAVRLITVPLVVLRLVFLVAESPIDPTFSSTNAIIVTSTHVNTSIITACFPFFKPVMDSMQSGVMNADLRVLGLGGTGHSGHGEHSLRQLDSSGREDKSRSRTRTTISSSRRNQPASKDAWPRRNRERSEDRASSESKQKMIIRADTTIQTTVEDRDSGV